MYDERWERSMFPVIIRAYRIYSQDVNLLRINLRINNKESLINMENFKILTVIFAVFVTISACSDSSTAPGPGPDTSLGALSCDGERVWDFGASDVLSNATSYVSESRSVTGLGATRFPCTVFWEYSASENCSLAFSYEVYIGAFGLTDELRDVGTSGSSLVLVFNDDSRQSGAPANVSAIDLRSIPDCVLE